MSKIALAVGMIEAENRDELKAASTAEEKLRIAFKGARNHWMFTDEDEQMRGAIGAAMHHMTPEERERVESELKALQAISAATRGVPVDFGAIQFPENPIGILKMWGDAKAA
jgi:hypothetical protein